MLKGYHNNNNEEGKSAISKKNVGYRWQNINAKEGCMLNTTFMQTYMDQTRFV